MNKKRPMQRLWMNKQIPIPEFEDEYKYIYMPEAVAIYLIYLYHPTYASIV
jgi:hypothetical protein